MSKYALLIGANYYNIPNVQLRGCIDDINSMKTLLINHFGYDQNNITMLHDDTDDPNVIPTRANMINALNNIVQQSANASEIWIHYSGHGSQIVRNVNSLAFGVDSCIVPTDFASKGVIVDDELFRMFSKSKCNTVILMDSCHSGSVCELPYSTEYLYGNVFKQIRTNRVNMDNKNIFLLSGCKDWQTSADIDDDSDGQFEGAFTEGFLQCMATNNYNVSIKKLYQDICNWIKSRGLVQKPMLSSSTPTLSFQFSKFIPPKGKTPSQTIQNRFNSMIINVQPSSTLVSMNKTGLTMPASKQTPLILNRFKLF